MFSTFEKYKRIKNQNSCSKLVEEALRLNSEKADQNPQK
uniref:Uncharacterized protein n=1 Tax=Rhizophora mucronata TaxID=61149 RepID=A0A2P2P5J1_RHIMU